MKSKTILFLFCLCTVYFSSCEKMREDCFLEGNGKFQGSEFDFSSNWCLASFQKVYRFSGNDKQYVRDQFGLIFEPTNLTGPNRFSFNLLAFGNGTSKGNQTKYSVNGIEIRLIRQISSTVELPQNFYEYNQLVGGELVITKFPSKKLVEGKLSFKIVPTFSATNPSEVDTLVTEELYFKGTYSEYESRKF